MHQRRDLRKVVELCIVSNFVEVFLAAEGHKNPVGINFLEKVQMPHLSSIYGAMLAGVGYVLMGAGIPLHIPGVLGRLCGAPSGRVQAGGHRRALRMQDTAMHFDPADYVEGPLPVLDRPRFLAIVSSNTLATTMLRRASGRVDGLVIETPHGRRTQCAAARQAAAQRRRRAGLWRARPGRYRGIARAGRSLLAGRRLRQCRRACARRSSRARPACRWARPSPSAKSPACVPI